jgi:hypothetical protein
MDSACQSLWADANVWPLPRKPPLVAIIGGIGRSGIVEAALKDPGVTDRAMLRLEPDCAPPCDALLWRLETAGGDALNSAAVVRLWRRRPFALTVRLVQYVPESAAPTILDEGTIGTRTARETFLTALDRLAMRFVRDAVRGRGRGPASAPPAPPSHGKPAWLDRMGTRWRDLLMTERWALGTSSADLSQVLTGAAELGSVAWFDPPDDRHYLADPFPWFGTGRILCEDMPLDGVVGRIVAVGVVQGRLTEPAAILDDGAHHSYPNTFQADGVTCCMPEAADRGATCIYRLDPDGALIPLCRVAPHARLADPTLFRHAGRFWIACTDLDLGDHDNLCLLHAASLAGPWTPHARWPVRIDVRGARCAGMVFDVGGALFRPGQDCAATYGAAIAIHRIDRLTERDFAETLTAVLRPDPASPYPHGIHTLVHDGERFWVDGKRFVFDVRTIARKLAGRLASSTGRR